MIACLRDCVDVTQRVLGRRCVTCQFDCEPSKHGKRRRHTGPDLACVQEIGLHSLPRHHPSYQYQTTRDHSYTGAVAATSGGNLGTAQQILPLKKQCQRVPHF